MRAEVKSDNAVFAFNVTKARGFFGRLMGLMYRKSLPNGEALLIEPCDSVHTFGMRFAIDVIFIDAAGVVLKVIRSLDPGKIITRINGGRAVLELIAGSIPGGLDIEGKVVRFEGRVG